MARSSPVEELVEQVRSRLHASRAATAEQVEQIVALAQSYQEAVDLEIAVRFAETHHLPRPQSAARPPLEVAKALLAAVHRLPELAPPADSSPPPSTARSVTSEVSSNKEPRSTPPRDVPQDRPLFPLLEKCTAQAPLVIVGGVPKLEKLGQLSDTLRSRVEWIDTTRQGTHAIGNLERRIRERRVAGIVLLEGLVSHKHSDPLVSAARQGGVAHAYGGKGGATAIFQAVRMIEKHLESAPR